MVQTTVNGAPLLTPEEVGELLVRPAFAQSVAGQVARVITTSAHEFRIPVVADDPNAQWVAEGQEIAPSDATLDEVVVVPRKVAGLSIITRELANDTSPEAAAVVGDGLARDIARKVDEAFFGNLLTPAPAGLGSITPSTNAAAITAWENLDPFTSALFMAESQGAVITSWVANPADAQLLATVKQGTGSNVPLIETTAGADGTVQRTIVGRPLLVSPSVAVGTVWGIPEDRVVIVVREDAEVTTDASVFFTSDRIAVRAVMRVGFGFPHPAAVVRLNRNVGP